MTTGLIAVGGLLLGGLIGWLLAAARVRGAAERERAESTARTSAAESTTTELRRQVGEREQVIDTLRANLAAEQQRRVIADTRLDESLRSLGEQRELLCEAEVKLKDAFAALSTQALRSNSEEFAKQMEQRVKPLSEALQRYETEIKRMEESRQRAYGSLEAQLKSIALSSAELGRQTTTLATALRSPNVKGRWGEVTLQRAVEVAGLSPHCDFVQQHSLDGEAGRLRPDMVVRLPGGRSIVVDAKAPTSAYLDALEADSEDGRAQRIGLHARAMRQHLISLSGREYWKELAPAPEFVVMFVPGESFFSAALEHDRELIEDGIRRKVILASPTTLIALLQAVSYSWQQQAIVDNARRIGETAQQLYDRVVKFAEHIERLGASLKRATDAYNDAVGSWEKRVVPMGVRITELGVRATQGEFATLAPIDAAPRLFVSVEPRGGP